MTSSILLILTAPSPAILSCFTCQELTEAQCTAAQVLNQCNNPDDVCAFVDAELFTGQTLFLKGCLDKSVCFNVCQILNGTAPFLFGQLQACVSGCCGSSGCNPGKGSANRSLLFVCLFCIYYIMIIACLYTDD